jgi:hypothetical protein
VGIGEAAGSEPQACRVTSFPTYYSSTRNEELESVATREGRSQPLSVGDKISRLDLTPSKSAPKAASWYPFC